MTDDPTSASAAQREGELCSCGHPLANHRYGKCMTRVDRKPGQRSRPWCSCKRAPTFATPEATDAKKLADELDAWANTRSEEHQSQPFDEAKLRRTDLLFSTAAALRGQAQERGEVIDAAHLERQRNWSERTFGPGPRTLGVIDHIRKELQEIEDAPDDVSEWSDVVILALDGAWRAGWEPQQIIDAIKAKQTKNEARVWPDWRTQNTDKAIEHDRKR